MKKLLVGTMAAAMSLGAFSPATAEQQREVKTPPPLVNVGAPKVPFTGNPACKARHPTEIWKCLQKKGHSPRGNDLQR
jgi:hypothetical protein